MEVEENNFIYKFRGKAKTTGKYVYGSLIEYFLNGKKLFAIFDPIRNLSIEVERSTIAQFINLYDIRGEEIYNDDKIEVREILIDKGDGGIKEEVVIIDLKKIDPKCAYGLQNEYKYDYDGYQEVESELLRTNLKIIKSKNTK
jgi:hypothetical protein